MSTQAKKRGIHLGQHLCEQFFENKTLPDKLPQQTTIQTRRLKNKITNLDNNPSNLKGKVDQT